MADFFRLVLVDHVQKTLLQSESQLPLIENVPPRRDVRTLVRAWRACVHARAAGPVDDDGLSRLVHVVLHAEVGRHPVDQHAVVGRHLRELFKGTEEEEEEKKGVSRQ